MGIFDFLKREKKERYIYSTGDLLVFYVQCDKCQELLRVIVRKHSELYRTYSKGPAEYEIQKEIVGAKCQNKINVHFDLKPNYAEVSHEITGGKLLTQTEYNNLITDNK